MSIRTVCSECGIEITSYSQLSHHLKEIHHLRKHHPPLYHQAIQFGPESVVSSGPTENEYVLEDTFSLTTTINE